MHPMLVHNCAVCNANTPVPFSASVFSEPQYCQNCSSVSVGVTVHVPNLDSLGQQERADTMQQDELATLFAQQMSFAPGQSNVPPASQPTPPPEPQQQQPIQEQRALSPPEPTLRASPEPITYISTHYNHSSHIRAPHFSPPPSNPSSTPPSNPKLSLAELANLLHQHSIDPSLLFPAQVNLFHSADNDQRLRLLELWRICPPTIEEHVQCWESGNWPDNTTLKNEEDVARGRWEEREKLHQQYLQEQDLQQREKQRQREEWARQDPHFRDAMDDDALAYTAAPVRPVSPQRQAEPYILSGYESLARRDYEEQARRVEAQRNTMAMEGMAAPLQESTRYNQYNQATDPVYHKSSRSFGQQEIENQYGRMMGFAPAVEDDEMMM